MVYATIYKLRYRALNIEGAGPYSDVKLVALSALPSAVPTPTRVETGCSETSVALSWTDMQPTSEVPGNVITGYKVYAALN